MAILITGGAGYIGSHMVLAALERGEEVVPVWTETERRPLSPKKALVKSEWRWLQQNASVREPA